MINKLALLPEKSNDSLIQDTVIMKNLKKQDINQEVFDLYDDYAHNRLERRSFLEKLSIYAVGGITLPPCSALSCPIILIQL